MHQSIPSAPSRPGNRGTFASLVSPGGGALANLARPVENFRDKDQQFVSDWLVQQGLEKLVDVFKGMFS